MIAPRHQGQSDPNGLLIAIMALVFVALCLSAAIGAVWLGYWWAVR